MSSSTATCKSSRTTYHKSGPMCKLIVASYAQLYIATCTVVKAVENTFINAAIVREGVW